MIPQCVNGVDQTLLAEFSLCGYRAVWAELWGREAATPSFHSCIASQVSHSAPADFLADSKYQTSS